MKWMTITLRQWYLVFASAVFLVISMMAGLLPPMIDVTLSPEKPKPIFEGNISQPRIALACNVFWGEEFLPQMLTVLEQENVHITFFIGGTWAKQYPDILKEIDNRGHELANHSFNHPHPNRLSKSQNQEQIIQTEQLIYQHTGKKTNLYAPPYGEYNDIVLLAAHELGYKTIMWSIDTIDWQRPAPQIIKNRVMKKLHNGAIILMHPTDPTASALKELISEIKAKGYTITTVSDILQ